MLAHTKYLLRLLLLFALFTGCVSTENKIGGHVINEDGFTKCNEKADSLNLFHYQDTVVSFKINLPTEWWLEQSLTDGKYGITTVDSSLAQDETRLIAVTVMTELNMKLIDYIGSEVNIMSKDSSMSIQKIGKHQFDSLDAYWIRYERNESVKTNGIVNYFIDTKSDRIFIVHSVTFGKKDVDNKLCHLQSLATSFKIGND